MLEFSDIQIFHLYNIPLLLMLINKANEDTPNVVNHILILAMNNNSQ
jgi:hypothetical protein